MIINIEIRNVLEWVLDYKNFQNGVSTERQGLNYNIHNFFLIKHYSFPFQLKIIENQIFN